MNESNLPEPCDLLDHGRFYGTLTARRAAGDVTLAEGRYGAGARIPTHAHRSPYFCLVVQGSFEERSGGDRQTCGPGTIVFHPAHEEHADWFGAAGARCFNLELAPALAGRLAEDGVLPHSRRTLGPGRASAVAASLRAAEGGVGLEVEEAVLDLLGELDTVREPARGSRPAWIERGLERLRSPHPPSIASLAEEAGVHPVYFARAFRAALRMSPSDVAARARLERAADSLLGSEASVSGVAHAAGFADHSHFCRHFRRAFGVTPSDYRRLFTAR